MTLVRMLQRCRLAIVCLAAAVLLLGCGIIPAPLPNLEGDLTLDELRQIQIDPTMSSDEKRALIRNLVGLADDDAGNRIASFLLNLNIPNQ